MSNISANIVVDSNPINIVVEPVSTVGVTVEPTTLNVFTNTGGPTEPGGNVGELQYNGGLLLGIPNVTWDGNNLNLGNVANVKISGGNSNFALTTDGSGNLSWASIDTVANANFANFAGNAFSVDASNIVGEVGVANTVSNPTQSNITSLGTLSNLTVNGQTNLGNVGNVTITGGTNGFVLQTDGSGNLTWSAATTGNGQTGGVNTQVQFNDEGLFGGNVGFTFDKVTGNLNVPNFVNANVNASDIVGTVSQSNIVTDNAQPNINSLGNLTSLIVEGTTTIQQAIEKVSISNIGAANTIDFNLLDQAILFYNANSTASIDLNIRGNSNVTLDSILQNSQSITCTFINKNGGTGYTINNFTIDDNPVTVNWPDGAQPAAGTTNAFDSYSFNIIKTQPNVYVVFGVAGGYY